MLWMFDNDMTIVSRGYYKSRVSNASQELQNSTWVQRISTEWWEWRGHRRVTYIHKGIIKPCQQPRFKSYKVLMILINFPYPPKKFVQIVCGYLNVIVFLLLSTCKLLFTFVLSLASGFEWNKKCNCFHLLTFHFSLSILIRMVNRYYKHIYMYIWIYSLRDSFVRLFKLDNIPHDAIAISSGWIKYYWI